MIVAPSGTCAWRRLFSAIRRPRRSNIWRMTSATASSWCNPTPITAAIASRVRSSWVGPRPPHTITASACSSIRRSWASMRPTLSPTLTCSSESMPLAAKCSPSHAELVSTIWPSRSSVPTARTSHRIVVTPHDSAPHRVHWTITTPGRGRRRPPRLVLARGTGRRSPLRARRRSTAATSTATSRRPRTTARARTRPRVAGTASSTSPSGSPAR